MSAQVFIDPTSIAKIGFTAFALVWIFISSVTL
jgi:hypothetical protein